MKGYRFSSFLPQQSIVSSFLPELASLEERACREVEKECKGWGRATACNCLQLHHMTIHYIHTYISSSHSIQTEGYIHRSGRGSRDVPSTPSFE